MTAPTKKQPTVKQLRTDTSEAKGALFDLLLHLDYSIRLLADYQSDLKVELSDLGKMITKSKRKFKVLSEKYEVEVGRKYKTKY